MLSNAKLTAYLRWRSGSGHSQVRLGLPRTCFQCVSAMIIGTQDARPPTQATCLSSNQAAVDALL
jgi:hypothetical protein